MTVEDPNAQGDETELDRLRRELAEARLAERDMRTQLDIEKLRLAEAREAADQTGRVLSTVLDNTSNGLVVYDPDGALVVCNRRFAEMYRFQPGDLRPGIPREELVEITTRRLWPDDPSPAQQFFRSDAAEGPSELTLPDGRVIERVVVPSPQGGRVITHTDITERKRVEADLREQRAILEDVFDNAAQGIGAYDEHARVITWNRKYQDFLILRDDQIYRGCPVWDLVMLHATRGTYGEADRAELEKRVQRRIDDLMSGALSRFEYVNAHGIEMEAVSAPRPQGGFVVTYADITDRKRAEAEIIRARDEAEAANRAKSSFLAAMSHEIRTPMNGVLGLIEVLQHTELSEDQRLLTETVSESATALLRIIDDILDFSKIEAGRLDLEAVPVPLRRTVEAALDTVATAAEAKGLDLTLDVADGLPATIIGDPVRLLQILLNLVGNAVKFTETGGVAVRVRCGTAEGGERRLHIAVTDTGIGIPPDLQESLFQPFSQAEATTTRRFGGTGLGLSICHRLVEMMGGEIGLDSVEGQGTTFHFTVPVTPVQDSSEHAEAEPDLAGRQVLIACAREPLSAALDRELSRAGVTVETVGTGRDFQDALERLEGEALVLVDDRLPAADLAAVIEALPDRRPAVLLRGPATSAVESEALTRFSGSLQRPVHRQPLLKALAGGLAGPLTETPTGPLAGRRDRPAPEATEAPDAAGTIPSDAPRILVAEDMPINRFVVERQLTGLGYQADYANDGRQALDLWRSGRYELLLTDCHMPEMDGFELTRLVREDEARSGSPRKPIIALTASAVQGEAEKCLAADMDDFLAKPVSFQQMGEMLARWLGGAGSAPD